MHLIKTGLLALGVKIKFPGNNFQDRKSLQEKEKKHYEILVLQNLALHGQHIQIVITFRSNTSQQRALEPPTMLICTFKTQVCRKTKAIPFSQNSSP